VAFTGVSTSPLQALTAYSTDTTKPGVGDLIWVAQPTGVANTILLRAYNPTGVAVNIPAATPVYVALFQPDGISWNAHTSILTGEELDLRVIQTDIVGQPERTMANFAITVNAHQELSRAVRAYSDGSDTVRLEAVPTGAQGNQIGVTLLHTSLVAMQGVFRMSALHSNTHPVRANLLRTTLQGGLDLPMNAGNGTSQLQVTGMTERLPLGILVSDSDFLCENPLNDTASALRTSPAGYRPLQTPLPLTGGGAEYSRFTGAPGDLLAEADGSILVYDPFDYSPLGAKSFRLYRGGGSAYMLSGLNPGGPIDWAAESFPASSLPVLKGGVLAGKALLVRNFRESPFATEEQPDGDVVTEGDEIQMVVLTYAIYGDGHTREQGVNVGGIISPTGYGEGYAAADRYRCAGRPMVRGYNRSVPDPAAVTLAPLPENPA
jgi:hypothetical protein